MLCLLMKLLNLCLEAAMVMSRIGHAAVLVGFLEGDTLCCVLTRGLVAAVWFEDV
jgi:hypothetical protein